MSLKERGPCSQSPGCSSLLGQGLLSMCRFLSLPQCPPACCRPSMFPPLQTIGKSAQNGLEATEKNSELNIPNTITTGRERTSPQSKGKFPLWQSQKQVSSMNDLLSRFCSFRFTRSNRKGEPLQWKDKQQLKPHRDFYFTFGYI